VALARRSPPVAGGAGTKVPTSGRWRRKRGSAPPPAQARSSRADTGAGSASLSMNRGVPQSGPIGPGAQVMTLATPRTRTMRPSHACGSRVRWPRTSAREYTGPWLELCTPACAAQAAAARPIAMPRSVIRIILVATSSTELDAPSRAWWAAGVSPPPYIGAATYCPVNTGTPTRWGKAVLPADTALLPYPRGECGAWTVSARGTNGSRTGKIAGNITGTSGRDPAAGSTVRYAGSRGACSDRHAAGGSGQSDVGEAEVPGRALRGVPAPLSPGRRVDARGIRDLERSIGRVPHQETAVLLAMAPVVAVAATTLPARVKQRSRLRDADSRRPALVSVGCCSTLRSCARVISIDVVSSLWSARRASQCRADGPRRLVLLSPHWHHAALPGWCGWSWICGRHMHNVGGADVPCQGGRFKVALPVTPP
jgi:hypothetical protein